MKVCPHSEIARASGNLRFLRRDAQAQPRREVADAEAEVLRFDQAREGAMEQLGTLYEETCAKLGEEKALLFQIHQMMLEDLDYCESITGMIRTSTSTRSTRWSRPASSSPRCSPRWTMRI